MKVINVSIEQYAEDMFAAELRTLNACVKLLDKTGMSLASSILTDFRNKLVEPEKKAEAIKEMIAVWEKVHGQTGSR